MQEEVSKKTVAISVSALKISAKLLQDVVKEYLRQKQDGLPPKKQNLRNLVRQGGKLTSIDIKAESIKKFDKIAKKYHIAYSVMRGSKEENGLNNYVIFFRSNDVERMDAAFKKYASMKLTPEKESIYEKLKRARQTAQQSMSERAHMPKREKGVEL